MEACFLSSNSFTKTIEVLPSIKGRTLRKSPSQFHYCRRSAGTSFAVACCQSGSSSWSPQDEEMPSINTVDWRAFRAGLIAREQALKHAETSLTAEQDIVVSNPQPPILGDKWVHTLKEPEKGCLLMATEKLSGVHIFEKTVILLLSTGPIGPTGLILNRPSLMSIKEMGSSTLEVTGAFLDRPLFFGGPLENGLFLVSPGEGNDSVGKSGVFDEVMKGLYFGTKESVGCAAEMVNRAMVQVGDFKFFDGYCAWEKEQLRDEIQAGYWTVAACSPSVIRLARVTNVGLWEEVLGLMGPRKVW